MYGFKDELHKIILEKFDTVKISCYEDPNIRHGSLAENT